MEKLISAQDIVRKFNLPYHTVNYYTTIGLLAVVAKKGTDRLYRCSRVKRRLKQIAQMANEGYTLRLIRKKLLEV